MLPDKEAGVFDLELTEPAGDGAAFGSCPPSGGCEELLPEGVRREAELSASSFVPLS